MDDERFWQIVEAILRKEALVTSMQLRRDSFGYGRGFIDDDHRVRAFRDDPYTAEISVHVSRWEDLPGAKERVMRLLLQQLDPTSLSGTDRNGIPQPPALNRIAARRRQTADGDRIVHDAGCPQRLSGRARTPMMNGCTCDPIPSANPPRQVSVVRPEDVRPAGTPIRPATPATTKAKQEPEPPAPKAEEPEDYTKTRFSLLELD